MDLIVPTFWTLSTVYKTMRCMNCGIATGRLRNVVSSLDMPLQRMLVQWLTIELPDDGYINCYPCFLLLTSETANQRILGHTMVCLGCGLSVRNIRHYIIESRSPLLQQFSFITRLQGTTRNYVCHSCWMRANRQLRQDSSREHHQRPPSDNDLVFRLGKTSDQYYPTSIIFRRYFC